MAMDNNNAYREDCVCPVIWPFYFERITNCSLADIFLQLQKNSHNYRYAVPTVMINNASIHTEDNNTRNCDKKSNYSHDGNQSKQCREFQSFSKFTYNQRQI
jgi:hypothetical protein